jgi:hypothetical protein
MIEPPYGRVPYPRYRGAATALELHLHPCPQPRDLSSLVEAPHAASIGPRRDRCVVAASHITILVSDATPSDLLLPSRLRRPRPRHLRSRGSMPSSTTRRHVRATRPARTSSSMTRLPCRPPPRCASLHLGIGPPENAPRISLPQLRSPAAAARSPTPARSLRSTRAGALDNSCASQPLIDPA